MSSRLISTAGEEPPPLFSFILHKQTLIASKRHHKMLKKPQLCFLSANVLRVLRFLRLERADEVKIWFELTWDPCFIKMLSWTLQKLNSILSIDRKLYTPVNDKNQKRQKILI